jgi:hypothetical protein
MSQAILEEIMTISYIRRYVEGKKYTQDQLIPIIVLLLGGKGGRAPKQYIEETIYKLFRDEFRKSLYHVKVANYSVPRWKHDIAWARERAKQMHDFIKAAQESGRGIWELTEKGKAYSKQLIEELKR